MVFESTVNAAAGVELVWIAVVRWKFWPVIVTVVPPEVVPADGLTEETLGSGCTSALKAASLPEPELAAGAVAPSASGGVQARAAAPDCATAKRVGLPSAVSLAPLAKLRVPSDEHVPAGFAPT
jgi:hypothetical protein